MATGCVQYVGRLMTAKTRNTIVTAKTTSTIGKTFLVGAQSNEVIFYNSKTFLFFPVRYRGQRDTSCRKTLASNYIKMKISFFGFKLKKRKIYISPLTFMPWIIPKLKKMRRTTLVFRPDLFITKVFFRVSVCALTRMYVCIRRMCVRVQRASTIQSLLHWHLSPLIRDMSHSFQQLLVGE